MVEDHLKHCTMDIDPKLITTIRFHIDDLVPSAFAHGVPVDHRHSLSDGLEPGQSHASGIQPPNNPHKDVL